MNRRYLWLTLIIPNLAFADAGIPYFFTMSFWQVLLLAVVIRNEASYLSKKLPKIEKAKIRTNTTVANLVSTFIGYLSLFFVRLPFQKCIFRRCGTPYTNNESINNILNIFNDPVYWYLGSTPKPAYLGVLSFFVLLLSCFLVSWLFEFFVFNYMQKGIYTKKEVSHAVCIANLKSYNLIFIVPSLAMILFGWLLSYFA